MHSERVKWGSRILLASSLLGNACLAFCLLQRPSVRGNSHWVTSSIESAAAQLSISSQAVPATAKDLGETTVLPVTPPFSWAQLESTNYGEYVGNLRRIQCPEETIRDIVSADLLATFERRRSDSSPPAVTRTRIASASEDAERLTSQLLGPRSKNRQAGGESSGIVAGLSHSPSPNADRFSEISLRTIGTISRPGSIEGSAREATIPDANRGTADSSDEVLADPDFPVRDRRSAIADLVRSHYGVDALLSWQREAGQEGSTLEGFLQARNIWLPLVRLQSLR